MADETSALQGASTPSRQQGSPNESMTSKPDPKSPDGEPIDAAFEISLRPPLFEEFAGQEKTVERLRLMVDAARQRGDTLQHILLSGPPDSGKQRWPTSSAMPWNPKSARPAGR